MGSWSNHACAASPARTPAATPSAQSPAAVGLGSATTLQYAGKLLQVTDPCRHDRPALFVAIDTPGAPVQYTSAMYDFCLLCIVGAAAGRLPPVIALCPLHDAQTASYTDVLPRLPFP